MAKRGPKSKDLKIVRMQSASAGSAGRKLRAEYAPRRPQWLVGTGRKEWNRLVRELREMGILSQIDRPMLALYCKAYAEYREADEMVSTQLIKTAKGNIIQHPAVSLRNAAFDRLCRIAKEFGMTPAARAGLRMAKKPKPGSDKSRFFESRNKSGA